MTASLRDLRGEIRAIERRLLKTWGEHELDPLIARIKQKRAQLVAREALRAMRPQIVNKPQNSIAATNVATRFGDLLPKWLPAPAVPAVADQLRTEAFKAWPKGCTCALQVYAMEPWAQCAFCVAQEAAKDPQGKLL